MSHSTDHFSFINPRLKEPTSTLDSALAALSRLKKSSEESHPFTVAFDLDGTLAKKQVPFSMNTIGDPRKGAKKWLTAFRKAEARIIIFTVRGNTDLVRDWLNEHSLPFDYVNYNPDQPPHSSGKVFADVYVDDRAVNGEDLDEACPGVLKRAKAHKEGVSQ